MRSSVLTHVPLRTPQVPGVRRRQRPPMATALHESHSRGRLSSCSTTSSYPSYKTPPSLSSRRPSSLSLSSLQRCAPSFPPRNSPPASCTSNGAANGAYTRIHLVSY